MYTYIYKADDASSCSRIAIAPISGIQIGSTENSEVHWMSETVGHSKLLQEHWRLGLCCEASENSESSQAGSLVTYGDIHCNRYYGSL